MVRLIEAGLSFSITSGSLIISGCDGVFLFRRLDGGFASINFL